MAFMKSNKAPRKKKKRLKYVGGEEVNLDTGL